MRFAAPPVLELWKVPKGFDENSGYQSLDFWCCHVIPIDRAVIAVTDGVRQFNLWLIQWGCISWEDVAWIQYWARDTPERLVSASHEFHRHLGRPRLSPTSTVCQPSA